MLTFCPHMTALKMEDAKFRFRLIVYGYCYGLTVETATETFAKVKTFCRFNHGDIYLEDQRMIWANFRC